jgi:hypothetical protein
MSVPTNRPFPPLSGSVDLTLTSELISNLISYKLNTFLPAPSIISSLRLPRKNASEQNQLRDGCDQAVPQ